MSKSWFAVNTQPHREFFAKAHLENQGFEVFLPSSFRVVRHARKVQQRQVAYFPGYIFVTEETGRWRAINGTRGVRRIISAGDGPAVVPPGLIEGLLARTDEDGILRYDGPINPGDRIRVDQGPFADFVGVVHSLNGEDRVRVLLDLMSSAVPVELAREDCMPLTGN